MMRTWLFVVLTLSCFLVRAELVWLEDGTARCAVDARGARILSYQVEGDEVLWCPAVTKADENDLWSHGGIPIAWPWFGRIGGGDADIHGYAWKSVFEVVEKNRIGVCLRLSAQTLRLDYEIRLEAGDLILSLRTENLSSHPQPFAVGFHPYFRVGESCLSHVLEEGGEKASFVNAVDRSIRFAEGKSRWDCTLVDDALARRLDISAENATGVNFWNPGREKKCPGTIVGDGWRRFIAIEPFVMGTNRFIVLKPSEKRSLGMRLHVGKTRVKERNEQKGIH